MKLVQILAKELGEWPEGPVALVQDADTYVCGVSKGEDVYHDGKEWRDCAANFFLNKLELATDHATAIVTRADWEAEKARIAGKVDGGWIRNRGRSVKAPVADDAVIEVRYRSGQTMVGNRFPRWCHFKNDRDIMAYRIHKPAEQPVPVSEEVIQVGIDAADAGKLMPIDEVKARWQGKRPSPKLERALNQAEEIRIAAHAPDPILEIRDRIRTLDTQRAKLEATYQRQIGEIDGEREELVRRLASEGLALAEVVQPAEDMSYPHNWKQGDVLLCEDSKSGHYTTGRLYKFICISPSGSARSIDDRGLENGLMPKFFKWHSRPAC